MKKRVTSPGLNLGVASPVPESALWWSEGSSSRFGLRGIKKKPNRRNDKSPQRRTRRQGDEFKWVRRTSLEGGHAQVLREGQAPKISTASRRVIGLVAVDAARIDENRENDRGTNLT